MHIFYKANAVSNSISFNFIINNHKMITSHKITLSNSAINWHMFPMRVNESERFANCILAWVSKKLECLFRSKRQMMVSSARIAVIDRQSVCIWIKCANSVIVVVYKWGKGNRFLVAFAIDLNHVLHALRILPDGDAFATASFWWLDGSAIRHPIKVKIALVNANH